MCSYLLVSFWFTRIAANQSSVSAFLTNRVGDCLLTVGMFAVIWSFGNNKKKWLKIPIEYYLIIILKYFTSEMLFF